MAIASIGNWLFNFAIGFFIPPGFKNITYKIFIIFGILCFGAAAQAYISYPETARKSLEEIEQMWLPGAPKPWQTKPGFSHLDQEAKDIEVGMKTGSMSYGEDGLPGAGAGMHSRNGNGLRAEASNTEKGATRLEDLRST